MISLLSSITAVPNGVVQETERKKSQSAIADPWQNGASTGGKKNKYVEESKEKALHPQRTPRC